MTYQENLALLDAAVGDVQQDLDLLAASAANLRSFASAYAVFASILSSKTGTTVPPTYNGIKAALEGLPGAAP